MTTTAPTCIDPYLAWFDIRETARPLNPYQLLKLAPLEKNVTRIEVAIKRVRAILEAKQSQADAELWQQTTTEFEAAIGTLLDPQRKAVLDVRLKRLGSVVAPPHSAPLTEAAAALQISCANCATKNPKERKFCAQCGQSLWGNCPQCKASYVASEMFCGQCGINVMAELEQRRNHFKEQLARSRQLITQHMYDEAARNLRVAAVVEDGRFAAQAEEAFQLLQQINLAKAQAANRIQQTLAEAAALLKERAYQQVVQLLAQLPEQLRNQDTNRLLQEAQERLQEIDDLHREVQAALKAKRSDGLFAKLERILELQPTNGEARQLMKQLVPLFTQMATRRMNEQRFDEAVAVLNQIPESAANEEAKKLQEQATELRWMLRELQDSATINQTLLVIAERLHKLLPKNELVQKQRSELLVRMKAGPAKPWLASIDWAIPPQRTALGMPIDWLGGSRRLQVSASEKTAAYREHPGRWWVACGLALQGIGQAHLAINLLPEEQGGLLKKFSLSFGKKAPAASAWGIDFGATALKAVRLYSDPKSGAVFLDVAEVIEYATDDATNEHESARLLVSQTTALKTFLAKHTLQDEEICVSMTNVNVLGRFIAMPPVSLKQLSELTKFEAQQQFPMSLDELNWRYRCLNDAAEVTEPRQVAFVAARRLHVETALNSLRNAGLVPDLLQAEAVALHNFLHFDWIANSQLAPPGKPKVVACLDVGGDSTNLVITGPGMFWFRSIPVGASAFNKPIVREFNLTSQQAELVKREPTRAKRMSRLSAALKPVHVQFLAEVQRSFDAATKVNSQLQAAQLFGCGGGFFQYGLLGFLRQGK